MRHLKKCAFLTVLLALAAGILGFGTVTLRETRAGEREEIESGDWRYKLLEDGTAEITKYTGNEIKLEIPESIDGVKVTEIGVQAFEYCTLLKSVVVPYGVESISHEAFKGCSSLKEIEIPYSVYSIADTCFLDCTNLSKFICAEYGEDNEWYYFTKDGSLYSNVDSLLGVKLMFYNATKKDIVVEDFVSIISDYAFINNKNINSIFISENIGNCMVIEESDKPIDISIGVGQDYDIYYLADKSGIYEVSANCTLDIFVDGYGHRDVPLEQGELYHGTIHVYKQDIEEINVKLSVNYGSGGDANDSGSVKYKIDGYTCTYYGSGKIDGDSACFYARKIVIEEGITEIPSAFCNGNDTVEEIYIADSVTTVGSYAFYYSKMSKIIGGNGIKNVGINAFSDTDWIRSQNKVKKDGAWYCLLGNSEILCDSYLDFEENYSEIENKKYGCTTKYIELPDETIMIIHGEYDSLSNIDGKKISSICASGWEHLHATNKDVIIPDGVEFIGWNAGGGTYLNTITFPSSLKYIYHNAYKGNGEDGFGNDGTLTSITLNQGLVKIGWGAFIAQPNLKNVVIPSSVIEIGEYAFGYGISEPMFGYEKYPGFTIYGYPDTAAEAYAKENGFTFIDLTDSEEPADNPESKPTENAITFNTSGEFLPKLEMTKDGALSAIAKNLTEEQLESVKAGNTPLEIKLTVSGIDKSVSGEDKELIDKAIAQYPDSEKLNFKILDYLDIRLSAVIDGKELAISETDGAVTVSLALEKPANENYKIVRIHDGAAEIIDASLNGDGTKLVFETDKFSTYAVIYSDLASGGSAPVRYIAVFIFAALAVIAAGAAVVTKNFKVLSEI